LPLEIVCSWVGRLSVKVPWNHLSSIPVEIELSDVLVVSRITENTCKLSREEKITLLHEKL
jgi:hypothetical protein